MKEFKPIEAIQSAYLCITTAQSDCDMALLKYRQEMWADSHTWVENAISQLMSAKYKLWIHEQEQAEANK